MDRFKPYEGKEPFIFISYAHADSAAVMEIVGRLRAASYRIWYDEGIEVGSEWPECIAEHLSQAHLVIAFISEAYMRSDNCRREMHYSLSKRKKIINVFMERTSLTPGMEMQIGNIFALMKYEMGEELFYERLFSAPLLNSEVFTESGEPVTDAQTPALEPVQETKQDNKQAKKSARAEKRAEKAVKAPANSSAERQDGKPAKKPRTGLIIFLSVLLLLFAAAVTLGAIGYFSGYAKRIMTETVEISKLPSTLETRFTEPVFEELARQFSAKETGITVGELSGITQIYINGSSISLEAPTGTEQTEKGELRDLSDLRYFTGLKRLYITNQPLNTLETLPSAGIEVLHLTLCPIGDLSGISHLPELRELICTDCPINELGDIYRCLDIKTLILIGSDVSDFSDLKPLVRLKEFGASNCELTQLDTVLHISGLSSISLYDSDLRGSFFKLFDKERAIIKLGLYNCQLDSTVNLDDFKNLSELSLINTGRDLDWSGLTRIPALKTLRLSPDMEHSMEGVMLAEGVRVEYLR